MARYDAIEAADAALEVALLADLGLGQDSVVVDLGSGTGQFAVAAAARGARVVAVDVSPVMMRALQAKVGAAGLANVDLVEAGFLRPGGVLRLWDVVYHFDPGAAEERIEAWCATAGIDIEGGWCREG
ncbi:MAG: methyltransferase domain-containing protein [Acidimicrobiia bacterium]